MEQHSRIVKVILYKHGVGYFEREGTVEGDATLSLTFRQAEVSDVLKSLTVLDLNGGHVASVSYDATRPLEQLLADVALSIPDEDSLTGLVPQMKGARVAVHSPADSSRTEGILLGIDRKEHLTDTGPLRTSLVSLLTDAGAIRTFELYGLGGLEILDPGVRADLGYYLRTVLSAKKKDARTFTFFARGTGQRRLRLSYNLEAPVWKATYRILLGEENQPPLIQGWAVVDNTQDEDWDNVELALVSGLPVSFVHDLYTPRYIRRPVVAVQETTGVLPPVVEEGLALAHAEDKTQGGVLLYAGARGGSAAPPAPAAAPPARMRMAKQSAVSSTLTQVRERKVGDLFAYEIEHAVTIKRNQSALVPIVLRSFEGRPVLLYNKATRAENPMRAIEFKNTTGLTLEGGPVTVLEGGSYAGEAMLETTKPDDERLIPYAVELSMHVTDSIDSHREGVRRVVIRDRRLTTYRLQVQKTTYTFHNKAASEQMVYLDHPRGGPEWQLFDTPAPGETTENFWRFRFPLLGKGVMSFVVQQRLLAEHAQVFTDISANQLGYWLEQRYVDAKTEAVLRQVIEQQQRFAGLEEQIKQLQEENNAIHAEQSRIRENLQALGDRPAEKELRERFVRTLNTQEDRLEQITAEMKSRGAERDRCREELNRLLGGLEYEGTVG